MIAAQNLLLLLGSILLSAAALWHGLWTLAVASLLLLTGLPLSLRRPAKLGYADAVLIGAGILCALGMLRGLPPWVPIAALSLFLFFWNTARIRASTYGDHVSGREKRRAARRLLFPAIVIPAVVSASLQLALQSSLPMRFGTALLLAVAALAALGAFLFLIARALAPPGRR